VVRIHLVFDVSLVAVAHLGKSMEASKSGQIASTISASKYLN